MPLRGERGYISQRGDPVSGTLGRKLAARCLCPFQRAGRGAGEGGQLREALAAFSAALRPLSGGQWYCPSPCSPGEHGALGGSRSWARPAEGTQPEGRPVSDGLPLLQSVFLKQKWLRRAVFIIARILFKYFIRRRRVKRDNSRLTQDLLEKVCTNIFVGNEICLQRGFQMHSD